MRSVLMFEGDPSSGSQESPRDFSIHESFYDVYSFPP